VPISTTDLARSALARNRSAAPLPGWVAAHPTSAARARALARTVSSVTYASVNARLADWSAGPSMTHLLRVSSDQRHGRLGETGEEVTRQ